MEREEAGETVNPKYELAEAGTDRVQKLGSKLVTEPLVILASPIRYTPPVPGSPQPVESSWGNGATVFAFVTGAIDSFASQTLCRETLFCRNFVGRL